MPDDDDAFAALSDGPAPAPEEDEDLGDDMAAAETQAAADLLDALASKDTQAVVAAFRHMNEVCGGTKYDAE